MIHALKRFFTSGPTVQKVQQQSLEAAQFELEEHTQAAEFHKSMIDLYTGRIARLSKPETEAK